MSEVGDRIAAEIARQGTGLSLVATEETYSWLIPGRGHIWFNLDDNEPAVVAQRTGGIEFPEPFTAGNSDALSSAVTYALRTLE